MKKTPAVEYVHEGRFVAEVDVELIETDTDWSPYFSLEDAEKIEQMQLALRHGDLKAAGKLGRVFELKPVAAE